MNPISIEEKLPYFMGTYQIGRSLILKCILQAQTPGIDDDVLIEVLTESGEVLLTLPMLSTDLLLNAIHEFEIERLKFVMENAQSPSEVIKQ